MKLYQTYAHRADFCSYRNLLMSTVSSYLDNGGELEEHYLLISKYLKPSVVDYGQPTSEEDKELHRLTDLYVDGAFNEDLIDDIAYRCIVLPSHLPEKKMEILIDSLKRDYKKGLFPKVFNPLFKWEYGKITLEQVTQEQINAMRSKIDEMINDFEEKHPYAYDIHDDFIVDDPWQATRGFKEDKYMVAYLLYIKGELFELEDSLAQIKNCN